MTCLSYPLPPCTEAWARPLLCLLWRLGSKQPHQAGLLLILPPALPFQTTFTSQEQSHVKTPNQGTVTSHDPWAGGQHGLTESPVLRMDPSKRTSGTIPNPDQHPSTCRSAGAPLRHPFGQSKHWSLKCRCYFRLTPNGHSGCRGHLCPCCHPSLLLSLWHMTLVTFSLCSLLTAPGSSLE